MGQTPIRRLVQRRGLNPPMALDPRQTRTLQSADKPMPARKANTAPQTPATRPSRATNAVRVAGCGGDRPPSRQRQRLSLPTLQCHVLRDTLSWYSTDTVYWGFGWQALARTTLWRVWSRFPFLLLILKDSTLFGTTTRCDYGCVRPHHRTDLARRDRAAQQNVVHPACHLRT